MGSLRATPIQKSATLTMGQTSVLGVALRLLIEPPLNKVMYRGNDNADISILVMT